MMSLKDYMALMKPRVIWLLTLSAVGGYVYAAAPNVNVIKAFEVLLVGLLSTGGAAAFNMYLERDIDALMDRTKNRPLPRGSVKPIHAIIEGSILSVLGLLAAYFLLGLLPFIFVTLGWITYVVVYTILLKRRSWLNVVLGGLAGNAAFLTGWCVVRPIDLEAILLSMAIYLWIPSHIWSLVLMRWEDYERARIPMLPLVIGWRKGVILVSTLNIISAIYMVILYAAYLNWPWGYLALIPVTIFAIIHGLKALKRPDKDTFRDMFKASSPILTAFITTAMIASILRF